ncbi:mRNA splicing factor SYF2 [Fistulina hepatica ATCC 64428]|uniref:Pre-mRNA-splicing factor SYF2 n=1 Tax=Fistulina hepatica ATCC 64428 TaxID=1128425 RepID=A0A0D7AFZ1_9AGAR|nr:mRNA splicing factor SYF2 [Fistulina hepatica ATCC 64428]
MESLQSEATKQKFNARESARLARQMKLAETLREKADAEERGEDVDRLKNWEWTIEENDEWEKKQARKRRRADFEFHDDAHAARRRYKKDLDVLKPDLRAYDQLKEEATNSLISLAGEPSASNTLIYGDHKPSEEAIDRVVGKVTNDIEKKYKFHRKRTNEIEGDITYINEQNRVFNKKIARYYDKYTTEIRDSFERGTAL